MTETVGDRGLKLRVFISNLLPLTQQQIELIEDAIGSELEIARCEERKRCADLAYEVSHGYYGSIVADAIRALK